MKTVHINLPGVNAEQLADELLAAFPALSRAANLPGFPGAREALYTVSYKGADVWFGLPDNFDEAAITALAGAHNPTAPNPYRQQVIDDAASLSDLADQYAASLTALGAIRTHMAAIQAGPASPTAAQTGAALKVLAGDMDSLTVGFSRVLKALRVILKRSGVA